GRFRYNTYMAKEDRPITGKWGWVEEIISRPRHTGTAVALIVLIWHSLTAGHSILIAFSLAAAWLIGSVGGGHYQTIAEYLFPQRTKKLSKNRSWASVLIGGWFCALAIAVVLEGPNAILDTAYLLIIPTCIQYFFAKIGCYIFGCCGWAEKYNQLKKVIPLQILEASIDLTLGLFLIGLIARNISPIVIITIFFTFHGFQRVMSRFGRGQPLSRILFLPDAGVLSCVGILLWVATF
ncbi:MAG: hypothetical protein WBB64_02175, partial [Anaerolineales bacterium]